MTTGGCIVRGPLSKNGAKLLEDRDLILRAPLQDIVVAKVQMELADLVVRADLKLLNRLPASRSRTLEEYIASASPAMTGHTTSLQMMSQIAP